MLRQVCVVIRISSFETSERSCSCLVFVPSSTWIAREAQKREVLGIVLAFFGRVAEVGAGSPPAHYAGAPAARAVSRLTALRTYAAAVIVKSKALRRSPR